MVQPAFDINNDNLDSLPEDCRLLVEISPQAFNYIVYSRSPDQLFLLRQYRIYTTADRTMIEVLEEIFSNDAVVQKYAHQAVVVYNFPEALVLPVESSECGIHNEAISIIFGELAGDQIFNEQIAGKEMNAIYRISSDLHSLLKKTFRGSQYWHLYTMILLSDTVQANGSAARVIFYNDKFIVSFYNNARLHLIQTFFYQTAEDVAYYLLLICRQFKIAQDQLLLCLSGLIDMQSPLYTELLKYFTHVQYEGIPGSYGTNGLLDEYPPHYFSPLLRFSLCV